MTSGIPFSDREKAHIAKAAYTRTWGAIARDLVELFPDDNGGHREGRGVRNYVRRKEHQGEFVRVTATVPVDVADRLRSAGLSPVEIGALVAAALSGRSRA